MMCFFSTRSDEEGQSVATLSLDEAIFDFFID